MTTAIVPQLQYKQVSEARLVSVSFDNELEDGETFTGNTPTVTEITTTDLTLDNKAVSTAALEINGKTVAIGRAIQFRVSGGTAGTTYKIAIQCATDATPAQTIRAIVQIVVIADTA